VWAATGKTSYQKSYFGAAVVVSAAFFDFLLAFLAVFLVLLVLVEVALVAGAGVAAGAAA
jgi:hypothetical protein